MDIQEAKFELRQYKLLTNLQNELKCKLAEIEARAYSLSGASDDLGIQKNHVSNIVAQSYEKVWKTRTEVANKINEYIKLQELIMAKIQRVESPLSDILFKRYIQNKKMERICLELNYDYYWLSKLHAKALNIYANL